MFKRQKQVFCHGKITFYASGNAGGQMFNKQLSQPAWVARDETAWFGKKTLQYYRTLHKMGYYFLYLNRSNEITTTASAQHVPGFCALLC